MGGLIAGVWLIFGAVLSKLNGFAAIGSFEFKSVLLYYAIACCTLLAITEISKKCIGLQLIPYLGKNSIVVLCTNNILIEILRLMDHELTGDFFVSHGLLGDLLFAVLLTVLEIPIIMIEIKHCKPLFGIRNRVKS